MRTANDKIEVSADDWSRLLHRVERLEDERAISDVLHQYCVLNDHGFPDEWLDLFTPDAVFESQGPSGVVGQLLRRGGEATDKGVRFTGHAMLARFMVGGARDGITSEAKHYTVRPSIAVDGDEARSTSYFLAVAYKDGDYLTYGIGRFVDLLVRCSDGRWRFKERIVRAAGRAEPPSPALL